MDALTAGSPSGRSLPPGLTPSEADALKPVGSVSSSPAPVALSMQGLEEAKRRAAQTQGDGAVTMNGESGSNQTSAASSALPTPSIVGSRDPVQALQALVMIRPFGRCRHPNSPVKPHSNSRWATRTPANLARPPRKGFPVLWLPQCSSSSSA